MAFTRAVILTFSSNLIRQASNNQPQPVAVAVTITMDPTWMHDGDILSSIQRLERHADHSDDSNDNAEAGPSRLTTAMRTTPRPRRTKARKPFISADHRLEPGHYDGMFRVVLITSGSVASVKLPLIVGELCRVCYHYRSNRCMS